MHRQNRGYKKFFNQFFFLLLGAQEYGEAAAYIQAQFEAKNKSTAKGMKTIILIITAVTIHF